MKIGFIDFSQQSTWKGILGLSGVIGWAISSELRDQIAMVIAGAFFAIDIYRDEYKKAAPPKIELQGRSDPADRPAEQLRNDPLPTEPDAEFGGNDRGWNG